MSRWNRQQKKRMRRNRERQELLSAEQTKAQAIETKESTTESVLRAVGGWLRRAIKGS